MKKNIYNTDEPIKGATNVTTTTDEQEKTTPPAQEFVGETPDEKLLKRMRLSQELREMSTGAPLDRMRDDLRDKGVNMLSTETVQSDIVRADNVRRWFDGINKDDEGYYDLKSVSPAANYEYGYYDIKGSVDPRLNERLESFVKAGYLEARRDDAGNIVAVKETNRKDVSRLIDGAISSTQVPGQMSGRAQSDYFSALTRDIIAQLPTNANGEIEYNGVPYQWGELYEAIYPIVAERAHDNLIESNKDYFNWVFEQNMGMPYDKWYKEYANNRITEMEKRIKALRDAVAEEAGISAEGAAREMAYSSGTMIPASVMGWAAKHGGEWEASKQFDDVLEEINNFRENGFLSGLDAGFDWLDVVTFGLSDLGTSYSQLSLLEKAKRGESLTESEKNVLELLEIKQEFEGIKQNLGWKPSIASAVGSGLGTTMEMAAPFGGAMTATRGIGTITKLSSGVTRELAKRTAVKQIGKNLIHNVGVSYARGAVAAPLMPSTYASYFNDLQGQYTIKEDGSVAFKPKNKALAFMGAYIDSLNEISSEYFGSTLGEIMGYGARAFGRVTRLNKVVDAVDNGIGKVVDKALSPLSDDAKRAATRKVLRGLLVPSADLDAETKEMIQMLGWTDGYVSETFSETFGDFMSQVMRDAIGAEHDYSQFGDADFWITQGLVSTLYGGALNTLGHIKEGVSDYQQIIDLGKVNKRLLDSIESAELRNKLLATMADGNIDRASQELADLFNEEYGAKPRFHDTDKAKALDFVRSNYTMHTIAGSVEEDSRMKAYLSDVAKITPMVYKGHSTNGIIIIEVVADGRTYYVLDGKPADKSESSMLTCVDKETGERKPIHASAATETSIRGLNEILQEMYTKRFSAHIEAERLASLKSAYEQMEQPSSEVAKSLMEQYGITPPAEGDVITLVDGRNAKVTQDLEDGTYVVRLEGDVPLLFTVPFYNIRSNDAFTAVAQRLMTEGKVVDSVDKAMNIAKAGVENGSITEEAVVAPEQTATEIPAAQAEAIAQAEVEVANDTLDMTNIPTDAEGNVAYDEINEPTQFAKVYTHEAGSKQQARTEVAEMRDATIAKAEQVEAKAKSEITASGKRKALREAQGLRERATFYNQVLEELEETEAGFSTIVDNEYGRQIAEPTKRVVDAMAKKLGLKKVRFVESVNGGKANAQINGDVVEIAFMNRDSSISFLMGHEFTHRMQDLSPQAYAEFKQMVKEYVGEEAWNKEFERVKALYATQGIAITDDALEDELMADMAGALVEQRDVFLDYLEGKKHNKTFIEKVRDILQELAAFFNGVGDDEREKLILGMVDSLNNLIADAEASEAQTAKAESAESTEEKFSARLTDRQIATIIEAMKANAEVAPQIELTPENWTAEFGAEGVVSTPIGEVKMGTNQYQKMGQPDRRTKLGMVKPTLTNPDVIIEEPSNPKDGRVPERNSSYVFVKAFTNADGTRDYMFTSVSNLRDGIEIVMSNQEKETPRIKRLLKEGKLAYINKATLPSEFTASAQGDQSTIPSEVSYSESKDTTSSPNMQEEMVKFSLRELDAPYLDAVERGDMETAQRMVLEAAKRAMPNTKVVDENGNPKVVYHGSNAQFTVFDTAKIGSTTGTADGRGFYFTTDKDYARGFVTPSGKLFGVFLNIDNPLSYDRKTITKAQLKKILKEADKVEFAQEGEHYMLSNYADYTVVGIDGAINEASNLEYGYADNDVELIGSLIGGSGSFELIMNAVQKVTGKSGMIAPKANDTTHYIVTNPSLIKSADPVTYDDNGNVIPLSERFNPKKEDIRYSVRQPIFYSNAEYAVRGIKQEKATPEQWLKMIEKNGGLKAGEDKWLGLSDWLKASDKKTLTKDEVLQYIAENDIQIEEVQYSETNTKLLDRVGELTNDLYYIDESINSLSESIAKGKQRLKTLTDAKSVFDEKAEALKQEYGEDSPEYQNHIFYDSYTDDIESLEASIAQDEEYYNTQSERADALRSELEMLNEEVGDEREINSTRLDYTTKGLGNKREIALVVPTIEPWNTSDNIHFGDAGEGRAVAWIRFGETTDADGKRVLVIDEIQSKRHQEGREKGYRDVEAEKREKAERERELTEVVLPRLAELNQLYNEKYGVGKWRDTEYDRQWRPRRVYRFLTPEEQAEHESLSIRATELQTTMPRRDGIPSAPFEKNWAELAMKRMLRYAAENGFDKVAWTTGDQQAERYDLGTKINHIHVIPSTEERYVSMSPIRGRAFVTTTAPDSDIIVRGEFKGKSLSEVYGKALAEKIMSVEVGGDERIAGDGLRIGGEGMKAFYDQMLPSFVRKYAKKWGATVGEVTMPDLEENNTMHAVDVTPAMRESVMQGQPKFSLRNFRSKVGYVKYEAGKMGIEQPIVVVETIDEYLATLKDIGVQDIERYRNSAGIYDPDTDSIIISAERIVNERVGFEVLLHERTHAITNAMLDELTQLSMTLDETNILSYRDEKMHDIYKNDSALEILNEIISFFVGKIERENLIDYFQGELDVADITMSPFEISYKVEDRYQDIYTNLMPFIAKNLQIQKEYYGKGAQAIVIARELYRGDGASNEGSKDDNIDASKERRARTDRGGANETSRGASQEVGASYSEVTPRLSVRQNLSEEEEEYKASLLEEAMRMEREATSTGADIAQEIADRTGWVHLADGNWQFYGEGKLDITKQASAERAAFRWLESKKAIKVAQIHKVYDPLIRDAGKIVDEINRSQKADYVKLKKYADKVEYILQGNALESLPVEDQVLADIALGTRLKWNDGEGKRGLKTELGLDSAKREKMEAVTAFAREYLEDYVARLMERNNGYEKGLNDNDIRNAVIEVFSSYPSPKAALEELYARYKPEADVTEAMDSLNRLEFERDNALAEVEAEYREIFEDFDKNPDKYVREHQESEAYNANLDMYVGTLGKVRKEVERLERNAKNRKLSDAEKMAAMRAVKSAIAKELRDGLGRFTRKYDIQRMMDAVNDARTPYAMLRAIDKAMESLFEIKWRREFARMQSLTKAKLTYGVTTTDPSTFLNTFVSDHKITAADARKIMNDYWRGTKANGVSVAKYIDDTTRQAIEFISQFLEYADAVATFKGLPATSIDDFARKLREKLENYTELANRKMKAMLSNDEVRKAIIDSVDILALYWKAQELQLTLNDDKHLRDINALELKVKDITAQLSEVNKQIKALADNKVVVTKSGVKDKDTLLRELQAEYNALLAERMEAYAEMYSAMPDIIKLMSDANNAVEGLLRTGRVNLSIERTKCREHEKELIADALADLASPASPFKDTRDFNSNRTWKNIKAAIGNTVGAPLGSMDYMLRKMGRNAPMGEGRLYNRFAYAFQEAYDNIYVGIAQRKKMLDDKCNELWSKKYTDIQKNAEKTKVATISYKTARANAKGEVVYIEKSADVYVTQAMYILAMWNQVDGRKALERQSFNEEKIASIRKALDRIDPRWNEFAEWVINEYLPSGREKYNAVHRATFGTSMAFVPNYFPIKRAKEKIQKTEDVAKNDADLLPSTVVGAIKERTSNVVPIDVSTSFFEALNENTTVMEAWAEMVGIIEDINTLLSNGAVKTTMEDISPSLFKDFKQAAQVATLSYIGKTPDIDKHLGTILNRLWAGSKIAFRLNTAFKQLSSAILFAGYDPDPKFQAMLLWRFVGGVGKAPTSMLNGIISGASMLTGTTFPKIDVMTNIEWARTHLPSFAKRWDEGVAGNELMARTTSGNTPWNQRKWHVKFDDAVRAVTKFGMKPNAFIDAFTSAAGARAVYDYAYEAFRKDGYSEEEAHRLAIIRAEMAFNTTQQSSEGLYLSPLQNDRSFLSTSLSTFMNAPYAMYRNTMISIDEILRNAKKELKEIEKMEYNRYMRAARKAIDKQVAEEVKQGVYAEGADAEQRKADLIEGAKEYITPRAQATAKRKLRKAKVKALVMLALNGYAGQLAFNLLGKLADLLLGDDDEEKKRTLYDMATNSLWEASLSMIPLGGQVVTPLINGYEPSMFPSAGETFKDMEKIAKELRKEGFNDEAINIAVKLVLRSGLGINLDTFTNIALGIDSMLEDGMSVEAILKVINAPDKQIRNYVLQRREGETSKEYTERVMRFYSIAETPISEKDINSIKWEDAYRRSVVLHYGNGKQLAEIEATRKAYRKTKSDGYGDMHDAKKERLSLVTSKINDIEKQLKRIVDDSLYYERLQVVTNLQKKYIELYEQFK